MSAHYKNSENYLEHVELSRKYIRLTVDKTEDLVVCRLVYEKFKNLAPKIPVPEIIKILDLYPKLIELITSFTEAGYEAMYRWGLEKSER